MGFYRNFDLTHLHFPLGAEISAAHSLSIQFKEGFCRENSFHNTPLGPIDPASCCWNNRSSVRLADHRILTI